MMDDDNKLDQTADKRESVEKCYKKMFDRKQTRKTGRKMKRQKVKRGS